MVCFCVSWRLSAPAEHLVFVWWLLASRPLCWSGRKTSSFSAMGPSLTWGRVMPQTFRKSLPLVMMAEHVQRAIVQLLLPWSSCNCLLVNVLATCECISGTDLIRQFYVLPHWDRSCRPNFPSHPVTVYWHRADQSQHWPYHARCLPG